MNAGATVDLVFQATVSGWGVYYVDTIVCFFASSGGDPGPCTTGNLQNSGKVAPVAVGISTSTATVMGMPLALAPSRTAVEAA